MDTIEGIGAVITGGASGIGLATAASSATAARRRTRGRGGRRLECVVESLEADGFAAFGVPCDVRDFDAVQQLADEAFRILGQVHVVFNNAGVGARGPRFAAQPRRLAMGARRRPLGTHSRRRGVPPEDDRAR